ncbi:MAG: COX15/CtaA family protein [Flavobacteriaceae bacterium]
MKNKLHSLTVASLIIIYLVIMAGAVVRMTGSGMGCPDWPKCFGYLIPPTQREQLDWKPQHHYREGEVIIVEESLRLAKTDFVSTQQYNPSHWEPYTKHDYAQFNAYHTWIEYINRLLGALSGIAILLLVISSLGYWKTQKKITLLALLSLVGIGFQGWLGKTVVDSNLLPLKITIHMAMALLLVAVLVVLLYWSPRKKTTYEVSKTVKNVAFLGLFLTLIQLALGTQVRQYIDIQMHTWNLTNAAAWLQQPPVLFYIHRSFSILVFLLHAYLFMIFFKKRKLPLALQLMLLLIGLEIVTGILMYYWAFPFASQPLHLLFASLLFGAQTYFILVLKNKNNL